MTRSPLLDAPGAIGHPDGADAGPEEKARFADALARSMLPTELLIGLIYVFTTYAIDVAYGPTRFAGFGVSLDQLIPLGAEEDPAKFNMAHMGLRLAQRANGVSKLHGAVSRGTERLVYRGDIPPDLALDDTIGALGGTFSYPFAYGYACVGEVVESGQAVFAFHPHQDIFAARASELIPLPDIDPAAATLLPLVETALQVTLDAGTGYRDRVVVLGAGVLGLLTGLLLQRAGWRPVVAEPLPWRRAVASSLGVTAVAPEELAKDEVPLVIDASGNPDAPAMALNMLAHEGTLLIASWFGTKPVVLPLGGAFHRRRLTIRSTQVSTVPARLSGTWSRSRRRQETVALLPASVEIRRIEPSARTPRAAPATVSVCRCADGSRERTAGTSRWTAARAGAAHSPSGFRRWIRK